MRMTSCLTSPETVQGACPYSSYLTMCGATQVFHLSSKPPPCLSNDWSRESARSCREPLMNGGRRKGAFTSPPRPQDRAWVTHSERGATRAWSHQFNVFIKYTSALADAYGLQWPVDEHGGLNRCEVVRNTWRITSAGVLRWGIEVWLAVCFPGRRANLPFL